MRVSCHLWTIITLAGVDATRQLRSGYLPVSKSKGWTLGVSDIVQNGTTGVSAMQMSVVGENHVVIIDQAEHNPLQVNGKPVWISYYDTNSNQVVGLPSLTNSFCASGSWLSNGTLINIGGSESSGIYGDYSGLQGIRLFNHCDDLGCSVEEYPNTIRLAIARWYPGTARLDDGSVLIAAGTAHNGGFNQYSGSASYEFFPPKGNGLPILSTFLQETQNKNLFPVMFLLSDGTLFIGADTQATLYNWRTMKETRLPGIPNGVIMNYPWSAAAALLPLTIANSFRNEILICGGSKPGQNYQASPQSVSSQDLLSKQCSRILLTSSGIRKGWSTETMPEARIMGNAVLTPDSKVILVNGASSGAAGYGNVANEIGLSNADNPDFRASLYDPLAPQGSRFTTNFPSSKIARMYHSTATLLADGRVMIAGSNPQADVNSDAPYPTEYQTEYLTPAYLDFVRPIIKSIPTQIAYGKSFRLSVKVPRRTKTIAVSLMDLGFVTHGLTYNQRLVELSCVLKGNTLTIRAPANSFLYPPGPAFLFILADGIPSRGRKVMVGSGNDPPSSRRAAGNMLEVTSDPDFHKTWVPNRGG